MTDYEFYDLRIPVTLAMYADVREVCSRLQKQGIHNVYAITDPAYRTFFEQEHWQVAGLRGSDTEIGRTFLLMRRMLNRSRDGVLPARIASNTVETLASTETGQ